MFSDTGMHSLNLNNAIIVLLRALHSSSAYNLFHDFCFNRNSHEEIIYLIVGYWNVE